MAEDKSSSDGYEVEIDKLREEVRILKLALVVMVAGSSDDTIGDIRDRLDRVDERLRELQELTELQ